MQGNFIRTKDQGAYLSALDCINSPVSNFKFDELENVKNQLQINRRSEMFCILLDQKYDIQCVISNNPVTKIFTENWVGQQSFFVLILATA